MGGAEGQLKAVAKPTQGVRADETSFVESREPRERRDSGMLLFLACLRLVTAVVPRQDLLT